MWRGVAVGCRVKFGKRQKLLMWLDGCKMRLTVESEEGEVPHLQWSQAPPLPWPRPGSADHQGAREQPPPEKGRGQLASLCIAGGIQLAVGYISTEDNPADIPSRSGSRERIRSKSIGRRGKARCWSDSQ